MKRGKKRIHIETHAFGVILVFDKMQTVVASGVENNYSRDRASYKKFGLSKHLSLLYTYAIIERVFVVRLQIYIYMSFASSEEGLNHFPYMSS